MNFGRKRKLSRVYYCIQIGRCKGQGGRKSLLKYDLSSKVTAVVLCFFFAFDLNDLAEVMITFFTACRPLSYYGASERLINASASLRSNTQSDIDI